MVKTVSPEVQASFDEAYATGIIPDFEGKGLFITWDKSHNRTGFSDTPHYPGQMPNKYPPEWPPVFCHLMEGRDRGAPHGVTVETKRKEDL